jgi:hypothetical protein
VAAGLPRGQPPQAWQSVWWRAAAVASANTAAETSSAYNAGYVAGATTFAMGAIYAVIPAGCVSTQVRGGTYYLSGNAWFQPAYGANGVYYRVVPAP